MVAKHFMLNHANFLYEIEFRVLVPGPLLSKSTSFSFAFVQIFVSFPEEKAYHSFQSKRIWQSKCDHDLSTKYHFTGVVK